MDSDTLDRIRSNDHRTLSKVISQIENDGSLPGSFFKEVHTSETQAIWIGITGQPGAGKSTLTKELNQQFNCFEHNLSDFARSHLNKKDSNGKLSQKLIAIKDNINIK